MLLVSLGPKLIKLRCIHSTTYSKEKTAVKILAKKLLCPGNEIARARIGNV